MYRKGVEHLERFPSVKSLRGELKRSEIRGSVRYQLTTKEFIQQRGPNTYRIALENILGIVECSDSEYARHRSWLGRSHSNSEFGKSYKIVTSILHAVTPTGVIEQGQVTFYTRLSVPFVRQLEALATSTA